MISLILAGAAALLPPPEVQSFEVQGFRSVVFTDIAAPRDVVWEVATGDVSPWWDHSFALEPAELVIEPVFGGRFYERLEEGSDDGALHARVIYVDAPQSLRLHGPLGLSGRSIDLVSSWRLTELTPDRTQFSVELSMHGEVDEELARTVRAVWIHFIETRLKTYIEADCHLEPDEVCEAFEE